MGRMACDGEEDDNTCFREPTESPPTSREPTQSEHAQTKEDRVLDPSHPAMVSATEEGAP
jgi:hypothetical protein